MSRLRKCHRASKYIDLVYHKKTCHNNHGQLHAVKISKKKCILRRKANEPTELLKLTVNTDDIVLSLQN